MIGVTDTIGAAPSLAGVTRAPLVAPDGTPDATSGPAQPFDEVLSGAAHEIVDKRESSNDAKSSSLKDQRPPSTSKKPMAPDTSSVPMAMVAPDPFIPIATVPTVPVTSFTTEVTVGGDRSATGYAVREVTAPAVHGESGTTTPVHGGDVGDPLVKSRVSFSTGARTESGVSRLPSSPSFDEISSISVDAKSVPAGTESSLVVTKQNSTSVSAQPGVKVVVLDESGTRATTVTPPQVATSDNGRKISVGGSTRDDVRPASMPNQSLTDGIQRKYSNSTVMNSRHAAPSPRVPDTSVQVVPGSHESLGISADLARSPLMANPSASASSSDSTSVMGMGTSEGSGASTTGAVRPALSSLDVGGLAEAISRPLADGNGGYTVVVAMHPAELGQLQAVMSLRGNDLQVLITPHSQMGHDALVHAVDTLKNELTRGGVNVNVTLRDPESHSGSDDRHRPTVMLDESVDGESVSTQSPSSALTSSQIHLIL